MVAESAGAWAVSLGLVAWLRWCGQPVPLGLVAIATLVQLAA